MKKLIQKYLLDNSHGSLIALVPKRGLEEEKAAEEAKRLETYKNSLSKEELEAIVADTAALKAYQTSRPHRKNSNDSDVKAVRH